MPATEQQEQVGPAVEATTVATTVAATTQAGVVSHVESRGDITEPFKMGTGAATRRDADQEAVGRSIMTS